MFTLPRRLDGNRDQPTGLSCPDCHGVLSVRAQGRRGHIALICRIDHVYSLAELLASAEERLDQSLRMTLLAVQELHDLLDELHSRAHRRGLGRIEQLFDERREQAGRSALALRRLIDENRALEIVEEMEDVGAAGDVG